jgi:2-polyprenyl-3-methyl-5-hydroxy-6-metoxy-1,4-benzoquinol methylase
METEAGRWNHNLHYRRIILDAVPAGCRRALDVGCGEGMLTRELHKVVPDVVGVDLDRASIDVATAHAGGVGVTYVLGDFLSLSIERESFDLVASVAALHHMDAATALGRMRDLLRPGGVLVVIGLARGRYPADLPLDFAAILASRLHRLTKHWWEQPSPTVWPPPETFDGMRRLAAVVLPGVRYRRHLLWRYSLVWTRPA